MIDLGTVKPGSTIRIPFSSFDKDDGSSITMTNYAVGDILLYKNGSTTERASTSGYTATTDFDAKTGKHLAIIDLADNTTADFFNAGAEYMVAIDAVTVDAVTTGGWIARFRIGYPAAHLDTTIATLATQVSFTLTAGPAEDDALNGSVVCIHDIASAVQCGWGVVADYTGATKTVTLTAGVTFTAAAGDNISFFPPVNANYWNALATVKLPLAPATAGRDLVVDAAGLGDANAVKVGPSGSGTAQSAGDLKALIDAVDNFVDTEVADIQARLPAALTADGLMKVDTLRVGGTLQTAGDVPAMITVVDDYVDTEVAAIKAKTDQLTFTDAGLVDSNALRISRSAAAADNLEAGAKGLVESTCAVGSTTTSIVTNLTEATDDHYNGRVITFTGGALAGQTSSISDYVGATKTLTVVALTEAPANTDGFVIS